jgi:sugar phosphate isomerase/epimerase
MRRRISAEQEVATSYRKGAFLNIVTSDRQDWTDAYRRIERFDGRGHVELWMEHIPSTEDIRALRHLLRDTEVIVHGPFIHLSLCTGLSEIAEVSLRRCERAIDASARIDAKVVTFHAGTYEVFEDHRTALERLAHRADRLIRVQTPVVTLENMPVRHSGTMRECLGRVDDLRQFLLLVPETKFTLDIGHCLQNGDDYLGFLREHSDRIKNIHLHDGKRGGRGHLRLGGGELELAKLVETLHDLNFREFVGLETIRDEDTDASWKIWLKAEAHSS